MAGSLVSPSFSPLIFILRDQLLLVILPHGHWVLSYSQSFPLLELQSQEELVERLRPFVTNEMAMIAVFGTDDLHPISSSCFSILRLDVHWDCH